MPGLIDDGFIANEQAISGLGSASENSARQYVQGLERKQDVLGGIGELAGTAAGIIAHRKKAAGKDPQKNDQSQVGGDEDSAPSASPNSTADNDPVGFGTDHGDYQGSDDFDQKSSLLGTLFTKLRGGFLNSGSTQ